jgi:hypothetical protein
MHAGIAQSFITITDSNNELKLSGRIFPVADLTRDLAPQKIIEGATRTNIGRGRI